MKKTLNIQGQLFDLSRPKVMGILNLTPDSFFEQSRFYEKKQSLLKEVDKMVASGVDILDVGGYSTRPGAADVGVLEEIKRVVPAVEILREKWPSLPISVDTFRSEVAREALLAGASMINDVSGGNLDRNMMEVVSSFQVPYIVMHMRGTPQTMQEMVHYSNVVIDVLTVLQQKVAHLEGSGVKDVILDVGFGFAKSIEQNFKILRQFEIFQILERPILAGLSRKSMIWKTLDTTPAEALNGTTALHMAALQGGASILRVHDVREAKETIRLFEQMYGV